MRGASLLQMAWLGRWRITLDADYGHTKNLIQKNRLPTTRFGKLWTLNGSLATSEPIAALQPVSDTMHSH